MEIPNDEIARLDVAARAELGQEILVRARKLLLGMSLIPLVWAFVANAANPGIHYVRLAAILIAMATLTFWLDWRYKLYLLSLWSFAVVMIADLLSGGRQFTMGYWVGLLVLFPFWFATEGYRVWRCAGPYAAVSLPGWERERGQVSRWRDMLESPRMASDIIEFSASTLMLSTFRYRLLKTGPYWVVAKFRGVHTRRLCDFRVRALNEVRFVPLRAGEMNVIIGKDTLRAINVSPPMFGRGDDSPLSQSA